MTDFCKKCRKRIDETTSIKNSGLCTECLKKKLKIQDYNDFDIFS